MPPAPSAGKTRSVLYVILVIAFFYALDKASTPVINALWNLYHLSYPARSLLYDVGGAGASLLAIYSAARVMGRRPIGIFPAKLSGVGGGLLIGIGIELFYRFVLTAIVAPDKLTLENFRVLLVSLPLRGCLWLVVTHALTAVWEERLWRGEILPSLREGVRTPTALIISSLGFGYWHLMSGGAPDVTGLALLGLMLGSAYLMTGSLWPAVGLHFANNLFNDLLGGDPNYGIPASPFALDSTTIHVIIHFIPFKVSGNVFHQVFGLYLQPLLFAAVMLLIGSIRKQRAEQVTLPALSGL